MSSFDYRRPFVDVATASDDDQLLKRRITAAFADFYVASLRHVQVTVHQGTVTLSGEVRSFYARQLLVHTAGRLAGEGRVIDQVRVAEPNRRLAVVAAVAALVTAGLTGCSEAPRTGDVAVHPVSGQVIFDGQPAAGAVVVFHPKTPSGFPTPRAQTDESGNFALSTFNTKDGAPVGEYTVTVELRKIVQKDGEYLPGNNVLPPRFANPKTSKLTVQVAEGANTVPVKIVR